MNYFNSEQEANKAMELALGRIFRIGAREAEAGDIEEYERCKWIIIDAGAFLNIYVAPDLQPNFARDCKKNNF